MTTAVSSEQTNHYPLKGSMPCEFSKEVENYLKIFNENPRMPPPFNKAFHQERRDKLMEFFPDDVAIIVLGACDQSRNPDTDFPFRQDSDFHYLTGFPEAGCVGIIRKQQFTLFVPPKNPKMETWTGIRIGPEGAKKLYGADEAFSLSDHLDSEISKLAKSNLTIHIIPSFVNKMLNTQISTILSKYRENFPNKSTEAKDAIDRLRMLKTPYEIALIQRANTISIEAHTSAMRAAKKELTDNPKHHCNEGIIKATFEFETRVRGCLHQAYPSITAAGKNALTLHYTDNTADGKDGELLLIDAGGEYGYCAADITRTWPLSGVFSPEQRALYDIVKAAHAECILRVKPGKSLYDLEMHAARVITQGLIDLGIFEGDCETLVQKSEYKRIFLHGLGHMLGMDVHDVSVPTRKEFKKIPFEAGMVITIEPGLYIDPKIEGNEKIDPKWHGIGIRIEDNILVTESGFYNFTHTLTTDADAVMKLMQSA